MPRPRLHQETSSRGYAHNLGQAEMNHLMMTGTMNLRKTVIMKTTTGMTGTHNIIARIDEKIVGTNCQDWDRSCSSYEERECDTYSEDTTTRGRSSVTASQSDY